MKIYLHQANRKLNPFCKMFYDGKVAPNGVGGTAIQKYFNITRKYIVDYWMVSIGVAVLILILFIVLCLLPTAENPKDTNKQD